MLGSLLREQQVQKSNTRDNEHSVFHRGNHKGENPATSLEIESAPRVKPKNIKMCLSMESRPNIILLMDCGERTKK